MSVNITLSIPTDVCYGMLQRGDCDRFVSTLISKIGTEFLKILNLNATIPLTDLQKAELTGRAMLGTWEIQEGSITAQYSKSSELVDTQSAYSRAVRFRDYRNVPFDNAVAMRDFLREKFINESAGVDHLNEDMQKINQTLWDPEESLSFAQQMAASMKLDRDRGSISKLNELCLDFHVGINSTEIAYEDVNSCSVELEGYIPASIKQAKETQVREEL